jgi:4-hydroxyphenylacetate 3-monooxygenase
LTNVPAHVISTHLLAVIGHRSVPDICHRSKDWGDQAEELVAQIIDEDATGLTIRGAKMLGTSSIMANEVFVANLQPLKPGEEAPAFSCALPMNTAGLRVLTAQQRRGACSVGLRQPAVSAL